MTKARLAALARDRSGATAIVVGLSMTALLGFVGMAVDAGIWYADRRAAQGAADSGAYSAAIDIAGGDTASGARTAAKAITAQYGLTDGVGGVTVTVNTPPASGPNTSNAKAVEVIVGKPESLFFSSFIISSAAIKARAVAVGGSAGGKYCVLALNPTTSNSVTTVVLSGNITLNLSTCGLQVDAGGSDALSLSGHVTLDAKYVSVVGNYTTTGNVTMNVTGATTTAAPSVPDPYANIATPTAGACTATNASYNSTTTISPGTYCNGLSFGAQANVTMQAGVYIVSGGTFSLTGGATVDGTAGVTVVLTGSGSNYATASLSGNTNLKLTAPTSGPTAGLAVFQDRNAPNSGTNSFTGGAGVIVTGALYFPSQTVKFAGNTSGGGSCTQLIAYDLVFTGDSTMGSNCSGTGTKAIGASASALAE